MNSETSISYYSILQIKQTWEQKINILLCQISAFAIHEKNVKMSYKNNKFQMSTWNWEFELYDESYSTSDIQDYFEYIY